VNAPGKGLLYGALVASLILLVSLLVSAPNGTMLLIAVAIGLIIGVSAWYQDAHS
jgi:hypothetical protein